MKKEILTGLFGLVFTVLAFGGQTGNSPKSAPCFDLDSIIYIEEAKPIELGFDTAMYLPADFNAYDHPMNFMDVSYIEDSNEVILGFDVNKYLPRAFNPYMMYFDLDSIEYIEEEEVIEFDFDIQDYLPADFKPVSTF